MKATKILRSILFYSMNVMGQCYTITKTASVQQCEPGDYVTYTITVTCNCATPVPSQVQVIDHLGGMFYIPSLITNDFTIVPSQQELASQVLTFSGLGSVVLTYTIKAGVAGLANGGFFVGCNVHEWPINVADLVYTDENGINLLDQVACGITVDYTPPNASSGLVTVSSGDISLNALPVLTLQNQPIEISPLIPGTPFGTDELVIDKNTTWINCDIWIREGMSIRVAPNVNFILGDCNIYACDMMWKGITVEGHGHLLMDNCSIRQAESAIIPEDRSNIELYNCLFESNFNAIYMEPVFTNIPNIQSVNFFAQECTFDGSGPFLPTYPNQVFIPMSFDPVTIKGGIGFAGVWFNDVVGNIDLLSNSFLNLEEGARIERSNARCTENYFQYMKDGDYNMAGIERQVGIYGNGMKPQSTTALAGNYNLNVLGSGLSQEYYKSLHGVAIRGMSADVDHTRMEQVKLGLYAEHCDLQTVNYHHNTIINPNTGISLWENSAATSVIAGHNYIEHPTFAGIMANDGGGNAWNYLQINDNHIELDQAVGIRASNVGNALIYRNDIDILTYPLIGSRQGMHLRGVFKSYIACNDIDAGTLILPPMSATSNGITSQMSDENTYSCNTLKSTATGFVFNGACFNSTINGNTMLDHEIGLWCSPNTVFGWQSPLQEDFGNNFMSTSTAPTWYSALHLGTFGNVQACKFYMFSPPTMANVLTPNANYLDFFDFAISSAIPPCQQTTCTLAMKPAHTGELDPTDYQLAEESLSFPIFDPETKWMGKKYVYARLLADSTLRQNDSLMSAFYANMQSQNISNFERIARARNELLGLDSLQQLYRDSLQHIIQSALRDLHVLDSTMRISATTQDSLARITLIYDLQSTTELFRTWSGTLQSQMRVQAHTIYTNNGEIQVSETYEENEQKITEIYLSLRKGDIDTLTSQQIQDLEEIIYQCPLSGGYAVFRARAIYEHYVNPTIVFDDSSYCATANISWRLPLNNEIQDISIYPNPAQDVVNIHYNKKYAHQQVQVLSLNGTIIDTFELPDDTYEYAYNVTKLSAGIYIIKIASEYFKLVVQ